MNLTINTGILKNFLIIKIQIAVQCVANKALSKDVIS